MNETVAEQTAQQFFRILGSVYRGTESAPRFTTLREKWNCPVGEAGSKDVFVDELVTGSAREDSPLISCIFDAFSDSKATTHYPAATADRFLYPSAEGKDERQQRRTDFLDQAETISPDKGISPLLELARQQFYYYPSGYRSLSVYERIHLTCCIVNCIALWEQEQPFSAQKNANCFLLVSGGISGIQDFIYTVSGKGALKTLRSRSFYIDVLMEHLVDELLERLGLPRVQMLYTGGGQGYFLLPNTAAVRAAVDRFYGEINEWLLRNIGVSLSVGYGYVPCTADQLLNSNGEYNSLFAALSACLVQKKYSKYTADQLIQLNKQEPAENERECRVCATSDRLDNEGLCSVCGDFIRISSALMDPTRVIAICRSELPEKPSLKLPASGGKTVYLHALSSNEAAHPAASVIRLYHQNPQKGTDLNAIPLYLGNYFYCEKEQKEMPDFNELAGWSQGISRLGVLRADIDNLGSTFSKRLNGVIQEKGTGCGLRWTDELSRQLTLFFKLNINRILRGDLGGLEIKGKRIEPFSLTTEKADIPRRIVIVYSGGDDVFLVGAWNQIIEVAVDLYRCFNAYTGGSLTFSAGIGVFPYHYPIRAMAIETGELENAAKNLNKKIKNAVALFGIETQVDKQGIAHSYCQALYHWDIFINEVIGQKLRCIQKYFSEAEKRMKGNGNSFLFRIYECINQLEQHTDEKINIARIAYLLARMAPTNNEYRLVRSYEDFSTQMYRWTCSSHDRKQLVTAIRLFMYLRRQNKQSEEELKDESTE